MGKCWHCGIGHTDRPAVYRAHLCSLESVTLQHWPLGLTCYVSLPTLMVLCCANGDIRNMLSHSDYCNTMGIAHFLQYTEQWRPNVDTAKCAHQPVWWVMLLIFILCSIDQMCIPTSVSLVGDCLNILGDQEHKKN